MTTQTQTLAEFVLARVAEREAAARDTMNDRQMAWGAALHRLYEGGWHSEQAERHLSYWEPARVLAECEAKRRIVELHGGWHVCWSGDYIGGAPGDPDTLSAGGDMPDCETLRLLALPYADHPEFQEGWRP